MKNIEILIKGVGTLELSSNLIDDFGVPLVFSVDDIRNFGSRSSSFTKTIPILGTSNNNKIFNSICVINSDGSFNMISNYSCVMYVDRNIVIDGSLVLTKIEKRKIGGQYQNIYYVNIFDEIRTLFDVLGKKKLSDLDYSSGFTFQGVNYPAGDHYFSYDNLKNNIESDVDYTKIYEYPLINRGFDYSFFDGKDLKWGQETDIALSPNMFYLSIYFRAILDRIFYEAGWYYNSEFINGITYDGLFNKIVNNYNEIDKLSNIWERLLVDTGTTYITEDNYLVEYFEWGNQKAFIFNDETHYTYISNYNMKNYYNSAPDGIDKFIIYHDGDYNINIYIQVLDDPGGEVRECITSNGPAYSKWELMRKNINEESDVLKTWYRNEFENSGTSYSNILTCSGTTLNNGDYLYLRITRGVDTELVEGPCQATSKDIYVKSISMETIILNEEEFIDYWYEGNSGITKLEINQFLPDMTQSDWLRNIIKMFNLFLWSDKLNNNTINIEPRDEFYKNGSVLNWTEKIDYSKSIYIKTIADQLKKFINFNYELGTDYYSKLYKDKYDEIKGSYEIELNNPYYKEIDNLNLNYQSSQFYFSRRNANIPILTYDLNNIKPGYVGVNLKPLIGIISKHTDIINDYFLVGKYDGTNQFINNVKTSIHIQSIGGFDYNLDFKTYHNLPGESVFSNFDLDDRTLYNTFYKNYIENLIDEETKLIVYYIDLNLEDILELDFRNIIHIDGQNYYLNKIEYDPSNSKTSKVELLKIVKPLQIGTFDESFLMINDTDYFIIDNEGSKICI